MELYTIEAIPGMFGKFCEKEGISQQMIIDRKYDREMAESKKVFIAAVQQICAAQKGYQREIKKVIFTDYDLMGRWVKEVSFRYQKDKPFQARVNETINYLK